MMRVEVHDCTLKSVGLDLDFLEVSLSLASLEGVEGEEVGVCEVAAAAEEFSVPFRRSQVSAPGGQSPATAADTSARRPSPSTSPPSSLIPSSSRPPSRSWSGNTVSPPDDTSLR